MLKKFLQLLFAVILLTVTFQVMAQHTLPDKVCVGTQRNYKVTGLPNSVFTWKVNGIVQPSTNDNIDIAWTQDGVYTIELQEHQLNCSSDVKSGTVTVLPVPSEPVSKGDIISILQDPVQTLEANKSIIPVAGISIVWYDTAVGGEPVISPTLNTVGSKTFYAEASNGICNSPLRTPVLLTILPEMIVPTVAALTTNDNTPIISGTATLNAGDIFKVTVNEITYTLGDGHLSVEGNNWSLQIPQENRLAVGVYSVTAIVSDSYGNNSEDQTQNELTIEKIHGPVARIMGSSTIVLGNCSSKTLLDASASSGDELVYSWAPSRYLDNPSVTKPFFHPGSTTRYLLTVTDSKGLSDTTSVLVVVADAPKAITYKNVFVESLDENIVLNASQSTGMGLSYLWSSNEGHILTGANQPAATVNGLGTYYLLVKDSFGCTSRDSVNVGLYIQAINDTAKVTVNESVTINVLRNDLPRGGLNPSSITIVNPPSHGIATLTADSLINYKPETSYTGQDEFMYAVCDFAGLCDNARVLVLVSDLPFFIPEAFSPNGDGKNDRFVIKGLEKYTRVEIEIFNRWGNIVYRSHNYGEGEGRDGYWNGTASSGLRIESGPVPSGTYYYILKMNGQKNISGAVYLDR